MNVLYRVTSAPIGYRSFAFFTESSFDTNYEEKCQTCRRVIKKSRIDNPVMNYQGGQCADFYSAIGPILISEQNVPQLGTLFEEAIFAPVVVHSPGKKYLCPPVYELRSSSNIPFSREGADVRILEECKTCGSVIYEPLGTAKLETFGDREGNLDFKVRLPERITGITLRTRQLSCNHLFCYDYTFLLCDSKFKAFCEDADFSNIVFMPFGRII